MNGLYLVNYRRAGVEPLRSIMHLPKEQAFAVAEKLYAKSSCPAHRRFGPDFPGYYAYRIKVEQWLYSHFTDKGGRPETEHPLYFVLERCDSLYRHFEQGEQTRILLDDIDPSLVSFTQGDSMAQMEKGRLENLMTKDELMARIHACGDDVNRYLDSIKEPYLCVEAQLWTENPFQ